jgi:DNA polymerase elongation subunit (family B)
LNKSSAEAHIRVKGKKGGTTMRRIITLDIETIPAPEPEDILELSGKKLDEYLKTSLNGDFGQILCIGYTKEDDRGNFSQGVLGWDEEHERLSCDEAAMLTEFWGLLRGFSPRTDIVVGHNIFDFDLKFIYKRSVIFGVRPSVDLSFARYRNQPIFDTMHEWERWG